MGTAVQAGNEVTGAIRRGVVSQAMAEGGKKACRFKDGGSILVSNFLAAHIAPGDEIDFPLAIDSAAGGTEIYIRKISPSARSHDAYNVVLPFTVTTLERLVDGERETGQGLSADSELQFGITAGTSDEYDFIHS